MTKQILLSLLNCSWQWGLLGGLTWFITRRTRRTNSTMHLLWLLFLLSLPILFALNQFVPAISIGSTSSELTQVEPINISVLAAQTTDLPENLFTESNMQTQRQTVTGSQFSFNWTTPSLIFAVWAIGILVMLIRIAFGLYRIHRLRRTATIVDGAYQAVCNRLIQKLNINRPVTVCFSDQVVSPISFGWLSPHILIPKNLNLEQFELVAAHELAHVQRLDWLTNLFSHLVGAVFFFHPIYHFLNRKLVHLRERICDDWVIQLTGARKNYAQCLLDMVHPKGQSIPLTLGLNEPSELESRINSILKNNRQLDLQPKRRLLVVSVTLLLTCLPLLAMAQLVPLRTVEFSLFAQTPQESEKAVEKVEKKRNEQKKLTEIKDKKEDKEDKSIEAAEHLKKLGIIWEEGEKLLKNKVDTYQEMSRNDVLSLLEQTSEVLKKAIEELAAIRDSKLLKKKTNTSQKMDRNDVGSQLDQVKADLVKVQKQLAAIRDSKLLKKKTNTSQKMDRNDVGSQLDQVKADLEKMHKQLDAIMNGKLLKKKTDVKPDTLEKWLNVKNPVIEIQKPADGEEFGKMLLNGTFVINGSVVNLDGTVVQFDELLMFLRNLPEERKSMLITLSGPDVAHAQIVKVMNIAKEAGIDTIGFAVSSVKNKGIEPDKVEK